MQRRHEIAKERKAIVLLSDVFQLVSQDGEAEQSLLFVGGFTGMTSSSGRVQSCAGGEPDHEGRIQFHLTCSRNFLHCPVATASASIKRSRKGTWKSSGVGEGFREMPKGSEVVVCKRRILQRLA